VNVRKVLTAVVAVFPTAIMTAVLPPAVAHASGTPPPPSGYHQTYSRNFASARSLGDWVIQPGNNTRISVSPATGLGVEVTGKNQSGNVMSSKAVVGPRSFVQALLYFPTYNGLIVNWPAFWTTGNNWPADGEIDILEGEGGRACLQTHYGTLKHELNSPEYCAPVGTGGWITVSMLRTGGKVTAWYNSTKIGTASLPPTAGEQLVFDNRDGTGGGCPSCNGPIRYPAADWLSWVKVWQA